MLLSMDGALSLWLWADGPRLWFWPIYSGQLWGTPPGWDHPFADSLFAQS